MGILVSNECTRTGAASRSRGRFLFKSIFHILKRHIRVIDALVFSGTPQLFCLHQAQSGSGYIIWFRNIYLSSNKADIIIIILTRCTGFTIFFFFFLNPNYPKRET